MLQILALHCDIIMTLLPEVTTFMNNHLRPFFVTKSVPTPGRSHIMKSTPSLVCWILWTVDPWRMCGIITTIVNHLLVKAGTYDRAVLTKFKFLNFPVPGDGGGPVIRNKSRHTGTLSLLHRHHHHRHKHRLETDQNCNQTKLLFHVSRRSAVAWVM